MKVDLIRKFKWYIIVFILVAIMLSVSLSFCSWDNMSIKAVLSKGNIGAYNPLVYRLEDDNDGNKTISVGDIVVYGRFYQSNNAITTGKMDELRWIVVDYDANTKIATLLTEKIIVMGNFFGTQGSHYQNYYQSTVRSWLNSGKGSLKQSGANWNDLERYDDNVRSDNVGSIFGIKQINQVNKGFLDVAFYENEKKLLLPTKIEGISGSDKNAVEENIKAYKTNDGRSYINDLVWIPSYQEIFGTNNSFLGLVADGLPNKFFKYNNVVYENKLPISNSIIKAQSTDYAKNIQKTSYTNNGGDVLYGTQNPNAAGTWFWLRSPLNHYPHSTLAVANDGGVVTALTGYTNGGVRPAVRIQI